MRGGVDTRVWSHHGSHEAQEEAYTAVLPKGYKQNVWLLTLLFMLSIAWNILKTPNFSIIAIIFLRHTCLDFKLKKSLIFENFPEKALQ